MTPTDTTETAPSEAPTVHRRRLPFFEGEEVVATKAKVTGSSNLDIGDQTFRMDNSVRLIVDCRVQGVSHKANPRGELERIHELKAIDAIVVPWDFDITTIQATNGP